MAIATGMSASLAACSSDDDQPNAATNDGGLGDAGGSTGNAGTTGGDGGTGGTTGEAGTTGTDDAGTAGTTGSSGDAGAAADAGTTGDASTAGTTGIIGIIAPDAGSTLVPAGQEEFRHDSFGDDQFWTDTLHMDQIVSTLSPMAALGVGLKVDSSMVPAAVLASADLTSPATTIALLKLDAVLGVKAEISADNKITRFGITCAICHSDVDNSVTKGVGKRLDGYANHDLNPGAIIALSPAMTQAQKDVLNSWGPGKFDPRWNRDGINLPVVIPPIYGLKDVALETYTGDGPISYWNSYVGTTQMGGVPEQVALALGPLYEYQTSLPNPTPPAGSFDATAAARGKMVFQNEGKCSTCHSGATFTDAPTLHPPADIVADDTKTADRSITKMFRTTPLRALWQHAPYFHDGSAATLADVVTRYNDKKSLGLTDAQKADLVEYLKSL